MKTHYEWLEPSKIWNTSVDFLYHWSFLRSFRGLFWSFEQNLCWARPEAGLILHLSVVFPGGFAKYTSVSTSYWAFFWHPSTACHHHRPVSWMRQRTSLDFDEHLRPRISQTADSLHLQSQTTGLPDCEHPDIGKSCQCW